MKKLRIPGRCKYLSLLVAGIVCSASALALDKGSPSPLFELDGIDRPVKLSAYLGKVVYLDFWASWCGPCRQSFPWMNDMQSRYGAQGLQIIAINLDKKNEEARRFLATTPAGFAIAFDPAGTTPYSYHVKGMPSSVLIGPDGEIIYEHTGFKLADRAELENRIKLALEAKK